MKVELLYMADCPNRSPAIQTLMAVLREHAVSVAVEQIEISDPAHADSMQFLGSPTIRINGRDVEPDAPPSGSYGLSCRTYITQGRRQGFPPREWISEAVRSAISASESSGAGRS